MKRPGPVGIAVGAAFAIPIIIELRTLLAFAGVDIPGAVFFPAAAVFLALVVGGLLLWPAEGEQGNLNRG